MVVWLPHKLTPCDEAIERDRIADIDIIVALNSLNEFRSVIALNQITA